jgi:hypothetical protein
MIPGGEFAKSLSLGRAAALELHTALKQDSRYLPGIEPELDIVVWTLAGSGRKQAGERAQAVFDAAAERHLHLALLKVPDDLSTAWWPSLKADSEVTAALRSCLMKPEHKEWLPQIREILDASTSHVLGA